MTSSTLEKNVSRISGRHKGKSRSGCPAVRGRRQRRLCLEKLEDRLLLDGIGVGDGTSEVDFGSIVPIVRETGYISLSVDGLGMMPLASGVIQVDKPAGATVRKAFLATAATGYSGRKLSNTDVRIGGAPVTWSISTNSAIRSFNHWAEVTSMVKSKIDAAPPGRVNFTIGESSSILVEGNILAVIFDDPNQTTNNTIALLFGAQRPEGETFALAFAEPIDTSDPNLELDMSLGIDFSYQPVDGQNVQHSLVEVNGTRLTTSAGGFDDGVNRNGGLITVGGLDDSNDNPADPFATGQGQRYDDELYSLLPFVQDGDTSISVFTQNPSNDDNIFFAAFFLKSSTAVVDVGAVLGPVEATRDIGQAHTVTAALQNNLGQPIVNHEVTFEIVSGPHAGTTGTGMTNESGQATFSYTGTLAGNDQVRARFVNSQNQTVLSNHVVVHWVNRPPSASADGPYFGNEGAGVTFDASGSSDPNGDTLQYRWDFNSDGTWDTQWLSTPTGSYAWNDDWIGAVTVEVSDGKLTAKATANVMIENLLPTAAVTGPSEAFQGELAEFALSATDPSPVDQAGTFAYWIDWEGDGAFEDQVSGSNSVLANHAFANAGTYRVQVKATDKDGGVSATAAEHLLLVKIPVLIDVKPGDSDPSLNVGSNGMIAVALFTTTQFDARTVDASTLVFAGARAAQWTYEDVDQDGDLDLVAHFWAQETNLKDLFEKLLMDDANLDGVLDSSRQLAEVKLRGNTNDGKTVEGSDALNVFLSGSKLRELLDRLHAEGVF